MRLQVNQVAFVNRALQQAGKDVELGARKEIEAIGNLVAGDAETLALTSIRRMGRSPQWAEMRVGQNNELVYVVPKQRGTRSKKRKRRNLAPLMLRRSMRPARERNALEIQRRFERLVSSVCGDFNR